MEQSKRVEKQYLSLQGSWIFSMLSKVLGSMYANIISGLIETTFLTAVHGYQITQTTQN